MAEAPTQKCRHSSGSCKNRINDIWRCADHGCFYANDPLAQPPVEPELTSNSESSVTSLKDSGERRKVATGAVRDRATGKGRFDLIPLFGLLAVAQQMERGAAKYSARNWEHGMPLSWFADAAHRHLTKAVAGFDDEPHWDAALWNLACLVEGKKRVALGLWPAELDDLPKTYAGLDPGF